ncbi:hypothetical protein P3342_004383 [Pyrenophora teres f. teres]|uniref:NADH2 dehydrogenase 14K chain n=2 Tax=Pyrenophora teres f. teres TaxID=97479 RepID=E3RT72_PYRTT|nr:hypothetical protein PTT_12188 [Pyrenophora teres f. teres 0-1]KAK1916828.1 hypothetical protein P3342_004383 [Pyrenophora teres f. teres]
MSRELGVGGHYCRIRAGASVLALPSFTCKHHRRRHRKSNPLAALTTRPHPTGPKQLQQQHGAHRISLEHRQISQFTMVHKILLWSGLGVVARLWQLGIERRPLFNKESVWVYPVFASIGGSFGYWLTGVEQRQFRLLADRRDALLEKRARRKEREEAAAGDS